MNINKHTGVFVWFKYSEYKLMSSTQAKNCSQLWQDFSHLSWWSLSCLSRSLRCTGDLDLSLLRLMIKFELSECFSVSYFVFLDQHTQNEVDYFESAILKYVTRPYPVPIKLTESGLFFLFLFLSFLFSIFYNR